jgi:membrane-associated phospholipid phosphatase
VRIRPLEALHVAALAVLTSLTVVLYRRLADPGALLLQFALMGAFLALVVVLVRAPRLPAPIRPLADFYPAALIPFVFESLGPLIAAARGPARDDLLIAADRALFGVDVTVWMQRFVRPLWNDLFYLFYASYYFFALSLGIVLWWKTPAAARRFIFTISFCYYVSYAGYFTIPALGPRFALADRHTVSLETTPLSRGIAENINRLERTKLDVFPSGHTMIAVAVLIVAYRRARRLFWILLPVAAGLIVSTVYCRYHYVVDVLAGALLAAVSVPWGERLYDRSARNRAS